MVKIFYKTYTHNVGFRVRHSSEKKKTKKEVFYNLGDDIGELGECKVGKGWGGAGGEHCRGAACDWHIPGAQWPGQYLVYYSASPGDEGRTQGTKR